MAKVIWTEPALNDLHDIFKQPEIQQLKEYFERQDDVSMAFVFGSYAKGRETAESDFDVAIYLKKRDKDIKTEDTFWSDISEILYESILVFIKDAPPLYKKAVDFLDTYLSRNMVTNPLNKRYSP